ncbi:MAG: hypothetical protein IJA19_04690, partial [Clostridia bacterium]|nr:hypothetical protein [Clostridia bacterium]
DKVLTSTYGSDKITGTIENTGNKEFETVSIQFKLYENGVYVGSASDYVYFSAPGSKLTFEASAFNVESFDEYELYYISACE